MRTAIRSMATMVGLILSLLVPAARGDLTVQWKTSDGGNGHYNEFVDFGVNTSWTEANAYTSAQTYRGSSGHLVTVNSAAEDDFLRNSFGSYIGDPNTGVPGIYAWIGLTDIGSTGSFHWITGEPITYTNWAPPEPNFIGYEHYGHYWTRKFTGTDVDPNGTPIWSWNNAADAPFGSDPSAYMGAIIEFERPNTPAVPEPSTLLTVSLGALGLLAYGSQRSRSV